MWQHAQWKGEKKESVFFGKFIFCTGIVLTVQYLYKNKNVINLKKCAVPKHWSIIIKTC
jgi:predicted acyltransferase